MDFKQNVIKAVTFLCFSMLFIIDSGDLGGVCGSRDTVTDKRMKINGWNLMTSIFESEEFALAFGAADVYIKKNM